MSLRLLDYPHLNEKVYTGQLKQGLKLVVVPKPGFRETTALLSVQYGGVDSTFTLDDKLVDTPYGLAHFLEHQVFENQGKEDFSQLFTRLGSDSNAFTSFTTTNYYFSGLDKVSECLVLLQDLVAKDRFTAQSMIKEKAIIKQEIDMYQDDPDYRLYNLALASLFPETALAQDLAGSHQSVDAIDYKTLQSVYKTFYQPQEMTLIVVGDVVPEQVFSEVKAHQALVSWEQRARAQRQPIAYKPVVAKQSISMDVGLPKLALGFRQQPLTAGFMKQRLALKLYISLLIGWTSGTYQSWYDEGKLDDSFDWQMESTDRFQFLVLTLDTTQPIAMSAKIKQVLKHKKPNKDVSEAHLLALKKELYGEFLSSLDRVDELASLYTDYDQPGESYFDFPDILDELSLEDVLAIGSQFFREAEAVDVTIFPK